MLPVVAFVGAGFCVHQARQYASAAPNERTTTAHVVSVYHSIFRGLRFNFYTCSYNFTVDGSLHIGLRDCPQWIIDDALKRGYLGSGKTPTGTDATVYYDPADPSVNSLLEFSAESQIAYRSAVPWIALSALVIFFFIFGRLLAAAEKRGKGGVIVDATGTAIYPEEIDPGSAYAGVSKGEPSKSAPTQGMRELYLEVANKIHPDRATNETDLALREQLMKEANAAFERGDAEMLRRVLEEYSVATSAS
jgi:hypothetical protein